MRYIVGLPVRAINLTMCEPRGFALLKSCLPESYFVLASSNGNHSLNVMNWLTRAGIDVVISTVDRPGNYIHRVVSRLPSRLPLRLFVGSPSCGYLERYRRSRRIEVIGVELSEWDAIKGFRVQQRALWNYWRCCACETKEKRRRGLLVLEDDVVPANGWAERLRCAVEQIEERYGGHFVLSLYTCYGETPKWRREGEYYAVYPSYKFWGTQAMYYPEEARIGYAAYLRSAGIEEYRKPYDIVLNDYLRLTGIPLFITTPCLFQHIGRVSTGLCPRYHRAGKFRREIVRQLQN